MSELVAHNDSSIESTSPRRSFGKEARHAVTVDDPSDFDDAVDAAETLDLDLTECYIEGHWEAHPSKDVGLGRHVEVSIKTAGRKWFHLQFDDGEVIRARPSDLSDDGRLRMLFD